MKQLQLIIPATWLITEEQRPFTVFSSWETRTYDLLCLSALIMASKPMSSPRTLKEILAGTFIHRMYYLHVPSRELMTKVTTSMCCTIGWQSQTIMSVSTWACKVALAHCILNFPQAILKTLQYQKINCTNRSEVSRTVPHTTSLSHRQHPINETISSLLHFPNSSWILNTYTSWQILYAQTTIQVAVKIVGQCISFFAIDDFQMMENMCTNVKDVPFKAFFCGSKLENVKAVIARSISF